MIQLDTIPHNPGCYLYKDNRGRIIYIGKAKDLRKRVSQYFQNKDHDPKTEQLVKHIDSVDFTVTNTEVEALILENTLVKKHQPKYNINLKDAKTYAYIKITKEPFPRLVIARKKSKDGLFFGPFTSGKERDYIMETLIKTFKLRTCRTFPKRACLRYHIKLCDAPCIMNIAQKDYDERIADVKQILKGKTRALIKKLEQRMETASQQQQFEYALELRDRIGALEHLSERQNAERQRSYDEDVINYIVKDKTVYLALFNIYKGTLGSKHEFTFDYMDGFLEDFLKQYYSETRPPHEVILPEAVDPAIAAFLSEERGSNVRTVVPQIGDKKTLLTLVQKNIEFSFFGNEMKLESLKEKLRLPTVPHVIECFDISHLSGTSTVASMVQFRNGKPDKSNYRRFRIRTVEGIDDFSSMAEVVGRRYRRLVQEQAELPDLIVIDGGKGQLKFAVDELRLLGLRIPIISLAKREEEIFTPGLKQPIVLSRKDKGLQLIQAIRDEAHRFAITYNRLLRKKSLDD